MTLTTEDRLLIETRVANDSKSVGVAYVLWFFTGVIGGHRFYLGKSRTGAAMLSLLMVSIMGAFSGTVPGAVFAMASLTVLLIWGVVDLFRIPSIVRADKDAMRTRLGQAQ